MLNTASAIDVVAVAWFVGAWLVYSLIIWRFSITGRSLSSAMDHQRRQWMHTMARRDLRMIDTGIMSGLQNGTAFFASTSLIAIGGGFALLNSTDQVYGVLRDLSMSEAAPRGLFEVKAIGLILIFGFAFFEFGWSYRLFNYASILVGATPSAAHAGETEAIAAADRAATFTIAAGRHFNHGLRAFFFAVGYLGWFINGWVLIATTSLILIMQLYRQFMSPAARTVIEAAQKEPHMTKPAEIEAQMRQRLLGLDAGRSIDPTELARALAGPDEKVWRLLMGPIRGTAIRLALAGEATILRKGKPADPQDFKGVYRIGRPSEAGE